MECQTVGQFKGAAVRCVKWSVKLWDSVKEPSEMAVLASV
jgi:hypothetical protein